MSPTKKLLIGVGALVAVLVVLALVLGGAEDGVEVETAEARVRTITQTVTASGVVASEVEKLLLRQPERAPVAAEKVRDEFEGEGVVARRDGRVHREVRPGDHRFTRLVEAHATLDEFAAALQRHKGAVPFVHVPRGRLNAQRAQQAHAADA